MIHINCHGGQIGRFWWVNSNRGGFFRQSGESCTTFRPGSCGWDETWPDRHSWPVMPWGKGDAADEHFRDFTALEPWFHRQMEKRKLDGFDLNIRDEIEIYSMLCDVFNAGIEAGLEAAKNRRYQVCGDLGDHRRLIAWHDNEVFIIEQALEQINAKLKPPSHPV